MRFPLRLAMLLSVAISLSGCALPYYWQAVGGQISLLRKRVPIETVVSDPAYDAATRARLETVLELRKFAVDELKLPDNDSYTSFVALDRPYVVWNVIATEEFSVEPVRWCFPIAGCVAYRGYFDRADAEKFEHRLDAQGFDTYSGGSTAYSTLGYFDDPVLSTMIGGTEQGIAGVLFHELAHQRIYVKGDSELSEAYATAVEEYGVELWLRRHADADAVEAYLDRQRRGRMLGLFVARQQDRLRALYARDLAVDEMRAAKADAFDRLLVEYAELKNEWGGNAEFDGWFSGTLNNATLVAVATYRRWLPGLRWRLDEVGIEAFYGDVEELANAPMDERVARLESWNEASAAGSQAQP